MPKIKGKAWSRWLYCCIAVLIILLIYTRFVNLFWGLPYPFHPDERNMAVAIESLNCGISNFKFQISNCLNPHFFAYGQFPLYLSWFLLQLAHFAVPVFNPGINFIQAIVVLRIVAATASLLTVLFAIKIYRELEGKRIFLPLILFTFSPALIQFSHFGTTESLLMFFYTAIIYYSLKTLDEKILNSKFIILNSLLCGLAIATKVSALVFIAIPVFALLYKKRYLDVFKFLILAIAFGIFLAPHNLLSLKEFLGSMKYEADVVFGLNVFYTRQFLQTIPILFQLQKIFPYALGWGTFILSIFGIIFLKKDAKTNLLRLAFFIYFFTNAFFFAKWTRFMAPIIPLMIIFASLFLAKILILFRSYIKNVEFRIMNSEWESRIKNYLFYILISIFYILAILPGIAYLSIYQNPDVRFQASDWIYKNIPKDSYILSETANVIDIPIQIPRNKRQETNYKIISFDFYDLDKNKFLQEELKDHLQKANYIFVPSRRIFANHCSPSSRGSKATERSRKYPMLCEYYDDLFSGKLEFKKVAEFSSYPKLEIGNWKLEIPDEQSEETWTVFDHPVIRIYKRT